MALLLTAIVALWFWLSLSPGSVLGFAFTSGDWAKLFRNLGNPTLQTKRALRSASHRSLAMHAIVLCAIWLCDPPAASWLSFAAAGVLGSYGTLLWSTRRSGWYGAA
jgi:hypothetical protein